MKYIKFLFATVLKLALYLIICCAVSILCNKFIGEPASAVIPPIVAAFISWLFLAYAEQGKRSFFATGYMLENIVVGAATGFGVFVVAAFIEWVLGNFGVTGFVPEYDVRETLYGVFGQELFIGIVFFGYFYHIIKQDFGRITAVVIVPIFYAAYVLYTHGQLNDVVQNISDAKHIVLLINIIFVGVTAGLISYYLGDMRSSCSFLCFFGFADRLSWQFIESTYNDSAITDTGYMNGSIIFTVIMLLTCMTLILAVKDRER